MTAEEQRVLAQLPLQLALAATRAILLGARIGTFHPGDEKYGMAFSLNDVPDDAGLHASLRAARLYPETATHWSYHG